MQLIFKMIPIIKEIKDMGTPSDAVRRWACKGILLLVSCSGVVNTFI
jgi:hypothetical protein